LAKPGSAYDVYFNPESFVTLPFNESGDLSSDTDVLVVSDVQTVVSNPDFVLSDSDSDGVPDQTDNCVSVANEDQTDIDSNGRGDACDDFDRDGVINSIDNCINQPNRAQSDEDGDEIGDACDTDESRVTEKYSWIPWVAMGTALLVFALLFAIVLRRIEKERLLQESEEEVRQPNSDIQ